MNSMIKVAGLLIAALTVNTASESPKAVKLRLDLPVGKTVQIQTEMKMDYFTDSKLTNKMMGSHVIVDNQYTVAGKEGGVHDLTYTITRMQLNQDMGGQSISYDSDDTSSNDPMAMGLVQQFGEVINKKFSLKVNELGKVVDKTGLDHPTLEQSTEQMFVTFPEKEISTGEEWTHQMSNEAGGKTIEMTLNYKVKEISKNQVTLEMSVLPETLTIDGETSEDLKLSQDGTMVFDRKTGQVLSSDVSQVMEMPNPQQGGKVFMMNHITQKTKS